MPILKVVLVPLRGWKVPPRSTCGEAVDAAAR